MKREELSIINRRVSAEGIVSKFGSKRLTDKVKPTICLKDVIFYTKEKHIMIDHVWCPFNRQIAKFPLREGDHIKFTCLVKPYYFAPDFKKIQGYGIKEMRLTKHVSKGSGIHIKDFIDSLKEKHEEIIYFT